MLYALCTLFCRGCKSMCMVVFVAGVAWNRCRKDLYYTTTTCSTYYYYCTAALQRLFIFSYTHATGTVPIGTCLIPDVCRSTTPVTVVVFFVVYTFFTFDQFRQVIYILERERGERLFFKRKTKVSGIFNPFFTIPKQKAKSTGTSSNWDKLKSVHLLSSSGGLTFLL